MGVYLAHLQTGRQLLNIHISFRMKDERVLIVIDEFPYIANEIPAIKSILQHIIDHEWKHKKSF